MKKYLGNKMVEQNQNNTKLDQKKIEELMNITDWEYWLKCDEWKLAVALCLSLGRDPQAPTGNLNSSEEIQLENEIQKRNELVSGSIKRNLLKVRSEWRMASRRTLQYVKPNDFLIWALDKTLEMPGELLKFANKYKTEQKNQEPAKTILSSKKIAQQNQASSKNNSTINAYKKRHMKNRDTILGAALCAVVNMPDACKSGNKYTGKKILEVIEKTEDLRQFVTIDDEYIMGPAGMIDLINACLKLGTLSKKKLEEFYKKI